MKYKLMTGQLDTCALCGVQLLVTEETYTEVRTHIPGRVYVRHYCCREHMEAVREAQHINQVIAWHLSGMYRPD